MRRDRHAELWLKGMYLYTAVGAGGLGLLMLLLPGWLSAQLQMPAPEPVVFGIIASSYLAFGLLALLGLREPMRFVAILLLQFCYKSVWLLLVFVPMLIAGEAPTSAWFFALIFLSYIVGDLMALPWRDLLTHSSRR